MSTLYIKVDTQWNWHDFQNHSSDFPRVGKYFRKLQIISCDGIEIFLIIKSICLSIVEELHMKGLKDRFAISISTLEGEVAGDGRQKCSAGTHCEMQQDTFLVHHP